MSEAMLPIPAYAQAWADFIRKTDKTLHFCKRENADLVWIALVQSGYAAVQGKVKHVMFAPEYVADCGHNDPFTQLYWPRLFTVGWDPMPTYYKKRKRRQSVKGTVTARVERAQAKEVGK